jgi:hypothetical protein
MAFATTQNFYCDFYNSGFFERGGQEPEIREGCSSFGGVFRVVPIKSAVPIKLEL